MNRSLPHLSPILLLQVAMLLPIVLFQPACAPDATRLTPPQPAPVLSDPRFPPTVLSAANSLFTEGPAPMADPRGKEYRTVTIRIAQREGGSIMETTAHGWVDSRAKPPQVVCWNGLIYPVLKLGPPADLDADVKGAVDAELAALAEAARKGEMAFYELPSRVIDCDEQAAVAWNRFDFSRIAMTLRLGRADLAASLWQVVAAYDAAPKLSDYGKIDMYSELVTRYAWDLGRRGAAAFGRGEDGPALRDIRACAAVMANARKVLAARQPKKEESQAENGRAMPDVPDSDQLFEEFWQVPQMLTDLERRPKIAPYDPVLLHPEEYPDKQARITALIRDLELVGNQPLGSTNALQIVPSVIEQMLANEDDDAVEPLLNCLEHDTRLTRCVEDIPMGAANPGGYELNARSVGEIAAGALDRLGIHYSRFQADPELYRPDTLPERHQAILQTIRNKQKKLAGVPEWKRPYALLADDTAEPEWWAAAARDIARMASSSKADTKSQQALQRLRALGKNEPSVHDLIVKRLRSNDVSWWDEEGSPHKTLENALLVWDGPAALAEVRPAPEPLSGRYAALIKLAEQGNVRAFTRYSTYFKEADIKDMRLDTGHWDMLWLFPDQPEMKTLAEWAFERQDSPWNPLLPIRADDGSGTARDLLTSPALGVPAFRSQVVQLLDNRTDVGTVTCDADGTTEMAMKKGEEGWDLQNYESFDPAGLQRLAGRNVPIRACDVVAQSLSAIPGIPRFEIHWPKDQRDAAITACKRFLQRYGVRFKGNVTSERKAFMTFPTLAASATPEQVAHCEAIFSLAEMGTARKADLKLPLRARWFTNTDLPWKLLNYDTPVYCYWSGEARWDSGFENEGTIWQAEDLVKDGKTQRYFGFVWRGGLSRVPAEQMEILSEASPLEPPWHELSHGVDAQLTAPWRIPGIDGLLTQDVPAGYPLMLTLRLRNRRAVPMAVDGMLLDHKGLFSAVRLRAGVTIHVWRARSGAPSSYAADPQIVAERIAVNPRKPIKEFQPNQHDSAIPLRAPGESFAAFSVDLRDLFDLSQPGYYAVWLTFDEKEAPFGGTTEYTPFTIVRQ